MIKVISIDASKEWDELVNTMPNHDVYYLSGYVKAFQSHGDGNPILVWWQYRDLIGVCVLMIRDIADDMYFNSLNKRCFFDAITPYGYGGFIFSRKPNEEEQYILSEEFKRVLREQGIISVFFRFHPILKNALNSQNLCHVINLGKTISLDLKDEETIWNNITSKNRNVIRKAKKLGVEIHHGKGIELLHQFKTIYDETMRSDHANDYYFFKEDFYNSVAVNLSENYEVFYASLDKEIISMAIIIFDNTQLHYHLSGSKREYRSYAPSNLLLYQIALWGLENGYKTFHLGGGVGAGEDPLYKFKAAFNRNSDNQFFIGKLIIDLTKYNKLVSIRAVDPKFNISSNFFPLYRS